MKNNIVLIVLDSVRKDIFNQFATRIRDRSGIEFNQYRTVSPWSLPSHASIFTGLLPSDHGMHSYNRDFSFVDNYPNIFSQLDDYKILGVSSNPWLSSNFNLDIFFDDLIEISKSKRYSEGMNPAVFSWDKASIPAITYAKYFIECLSHDHTTKSIVNGVLEKVDHLSHQLPIPKFTDDGANSVIRNALNTIDDSQEPYFLFLNFMDAHGPYTMLSSYNQDIASVPYSWSSASEDLLELNINSGERKLFKNYYRNAYKLAVEYLDRKIDRLVEQISRQSKRDTTILITSDHGQNLGYSIENNQYGHFASLSEGLLHVPLNIINPPTELVSNKSSIANVQTSSLKLKEIISCIKYRNELNLNENVSQSELVGGGPLLDEVEKEDIEDYEYWNRIQRACILGSTKYVWDNQGNFSQYKMDMDKPSYQDEINPAPERDGVLDNRYYNVRICEIIDSVNEVNTSINPELEGRLSDLGYL